MAWLGHYSTCMTYLHSEHNPLTRDEVVGVGQDQFSLAYTPHIWNSLKVLVHERRLKCHSDGALIKICSRIWTGDKEGDATSRSVTHQDRLRLALNLEQ